YRAKWVETTPRTGSVVELIGYETMSNYVLPFEIVSILLLVALMGAAYIARPDRTKITEMIRRLEN
ncbi:MAG: NADH-quinone oxidoreductase subunit J, partial [Chloroherpetonaceae bacterium]|nr:NADH-quinone oxidoreductase subunit J [Chloroherpetonaceae bacterium]